MKEGYKVDKNVFKDFQFKIDVGIARKQKDCEICKVERMARIQKLIKLSSPPEDERRTRK